MEVPDIVRAYVDAFCRGDLEAIRETFEPEGTYEDPGTTEPVLGDRIDRHFAEAFSAMPDITTETTGLDAISEQVSVWRWIIRATQTNTFRGLPPTGRSITFPGCEFIEVRDGKIHKIVGYYDRLTMLIQLGFAITPPAPVNA